MTLTVDFGEVSVGSAYGDVLLEICLVWLDRKEWTATSVDLQKQVFAYLERQYRDCHIFYCFGSEAVYEINFIKAAESEKYKVSEDTLKKIFAKHIYPLVKHKKLRREEITVPRLK